MIFSVFLQWDLRWLLKDEHIAFYYRVLHALQSPSKRQDDFHYFSTLPFGTVFFTGGFVSYRKKHRASNKTETDGEEKEENVNNAPSGKKGFLINTKQYLVSQA